MTGFAVYDDRVLLRAKFLRPVPNLLNERTGGIVFMHLHAFVEQKIFNLQGRTESGNPNDIVWSNLIPANQLPSVCVHDKPDTPALKVVVHLLVVDHLAKEIDFSNRILFERFVAYFDRIFYTVTKSEVPGEVEYDRTKIQDRRGKILLAQILQPPHFLDPPGQRGPVVGWYVKLFDNSSLSVLTAKLGRLFVVMGRKKKNICGRRGRIYYAAFESLSSRTVFLRGSFFSRSNHITSTRFFLMYFNTSITLPSVLLRTWSPFLNNLLIHSNLLSYFRNA